MSDSHADCTASMAATEAADAAAAPRGGLLTRSFLALLATQFFGALNDNMFRWFVVPIGEAIAPVAYKKAVVSVGLALLVLPFILFVAPAGYVSDRFSKRNVIVGCKVAEVLLMTLGLAAILYGSIPIMFLVLFLMGTHSAVFSPSKYGSIPEIICPDRISGANGLIGMTTIVGIAAGSVAGGWLYSWTSSPGQSPGQYHWWIAASALLGVACAGLLTSLLIRPLRSANPSRPFPVNLARETYHNLSELFAAKPLLLAALGSALFWGLAGLYQLNIYEFAKDDLGVPVQYFGPLVGILVVGVGIGYVLAGICSGARIELGIVPVAAAGLAVTSMLMFMVRDGNGSPYSTSYLLSCLFLFTLGISGGMYDVPLQSFLQYHSPQQSRGSILAANNFLAFAFTFVASGLFYLLSGVLGLSGRAIFLLCGLALLPLAVISARRLPQPTLGFVMRVVMRLLFRVEIEGLENLPKQGGVLVLANHVSYVDGFLIGLVSPRHVRFMVFAPYFRPWYARWFARVADVLPLEPGRRSAVESVRAARKALGSGDVVGIFPEGEVTHTGEIQQFQPGFLKVLKGTDALIMPVHLSGLWGTIFSFQRGKMSSQRPGHWRFAVRIRFGQPMAAPKSVDEVRQALIRLGENR